MSTKPAPSPAVIAVAVTEAELVEIMRRRRHALGLSQMELDERIGWQDGYTGKVEQPQGRARSGKKYGRRSVHGSFYQWLEGLGFAVALIPKELVNSPPDGGTLILDYVGNLPAPAPPGPKSMLHHVHHVGLVNPEKRRRRQRKSEAA